MPNNYDPPGVRVLGDRWEFVIAVVDSMDAPKDLTGSTVTLGIGASVAQLYSTKTATLANQTTATGQATAVFLPSETLSLVIPQSGRMYYEVDVTFDSNNREVVAFGYIRVRKTLF
jgi:hypothetical protein